VAVIVEVDVPFAGIEDELAVTVTVYGVFAGAGYTVWSIVTVPLPVGEVVSEAVIV
jgi:hypothetical protein